VIARFLQAGLVVAVAASGCAKSPTAAEDGGTSCHATMPPMPLVHIGPDVALRVVCGATAQAPVASVDELGPSGTIWSISLAGDAAFFLLAQGFVTKQASGPSVAFVSFQAPPSALPGDTFSTVATIHADCGAFPDGKVNVRATIVPASATTTTSTIDFGDVPVGESAPPRALTVVLADGTETFTLDPQLDPRPFSISLGSTTMGSNLRPLVVGFRSSVPGDQSAVATWTVAPGMGLAPTAVGCTTGLTVTLHARAVEVDAGVDGTDASDGATEGP
jgi:hypothetical protein